MSPMACIANTVEIIKPRVFFPANSLAIVALTGKSPPMPKPKNEAKRDEPLGHEMIASIVGAAWSCGHFPRLSHGRRYSTMALGLLADNAGRSLALVRSPMI
jgi:hypothetical protein